MTPELEREWHRLKVFRKWKMRKFFNCSYHGHTTIPTPSIAGADNIPFICSGMRVVDILGPISCINSKFSYGYRFGSGCQTCYPLGFEIGQPAVIRVSDELINYFGSGMELLKKLQGAHPAQSEERNRDGAQS